MGSDLYVPGVLKASGIARGDRVTVYSPNNIPLGSGVAMIDSKTLHELKKKAHRGARLGVFVKLTEPMYKSVRVAELPGAREGLVYGQSLPSMYVARLLDPRPGEKVIDLTAAPGGKVSHVAQLAGRDSVIVAVDRRSKVERLRKTLETLGIDWVRVLGADSRYLHVDHPSLQESFDKALLDPPCSNLGVIPKVMDERSHRDSRNLALYQYQLAKAASKLLRKNGLLAYSVCTLTYTEAEAQAQRIAEELGFEVLAPPKWARKPLRTSHGLWFSPLHHGVTGFYISILKKK
ncbi:MAG: 16S rRNA methyltransferase [Desulfurococcales archaeon]|nr:16S rRNA methyltransferase [Desulfurococcales archaeon]